MPPTIILPGEVTRNFAYACHGCGMGFRKGEELAWQRHVVRCSDENLDRLVRDVRAVDLFAGVRDVELESWVRRNRRAILEDRVRI